MTINDKSKWIVNHWVIVIRWYVSFVDEKNSIKRIASNDAMKNISLY